MISDVKVVVRSTGERTESLCRNLVLSQGVPPENVATVCERPFSLAMKTAFEIGLAGDLPWTFCVDADVLLRPGSIKKMLELAEQQSNHICEIQGYVLCKYFGGPRTAGNHLYRTSLLDRVIDNIPIEGVDIRPEFHTLEAMKEQGNPWVTVPYLVGLHDFEQYHRDIFRKCFVQAHKHEYLSDLFVQFWREGANSDEDYRVALAGFARGIEHIGPVFIDAKAELFRAGFDALMLEEKRLPNETRWSLDRVESIIQSWKESAIYLKKFPDRLGLDITYAEHSGHSPDQTIKDRLRKKYEKIGFVNTFIYLLGRGLEHIGNGLLQWSSK